MFLRSKTRCVDKRSLSTGIGVGLAAIGGAGSVVLVLGNGLLGQLYIRDSVALQSSGLEGPGLVVLVPLQTLDFLSAISSYFVDISILVSVDVSSTVLLKVGSFSKVMKSMLA